MSNINDIYYLQVNGESQLEKELRETSGLANKVIDLTALHRNEQTQEVEGLGEDGVVI